MSNTIKTRISWRRWRPQSRRIHLPIFFNYLEQFAVWMQTDPSVLRMMTRMPLNLKYLQVWFLSWKRTDECSEGMSKRSLCQQNSSTSCSQTNYLALTPTSISAHDVPPSASQKL